MRQREGENNDQHAHYRHSAQTSQARTSEKYKLKSSAENAWYEFNIETIKVSVITTYLQNRRNSIKSPIRDFQVHFEQIETLFWCRLVVGRVDVFEYRCDYTLTHKVSGFSKSSLALRLATNNPAQQAVILTSRITQARNGVSGSDVTLRQHWRQVFFLWEPPLLRLLLESRNWNVVQIRKSIIEWLNRLN